MIRFLFRFIGVLCLAAAFVLVIYDGTKSIASNSLYFTSVRALWDTINATSLENLKPAMLPYAHGMLWDPGMLTFLQFPSWAVLAVLGGIFVLLGRKKKPLIGFVRP